jgi:hypothetical protein
MLDCTPAAYWPGILTYVLPPLGALLSATALWVASRARNTSLDAQSISLGRADRSNTLPASFERRAQRTDTDTPPRS